MRCTLPTLLATLLLALPLVAGAQVYKWKDARGTDHFSDSPPPNGVKYTVVKTRRDDVRPGVAPKAGSDASGNAGASGGSSASGQDGQSGRDAQLKRFCAQIQSNIDLLKSSQVIGQQGSDGKTVMLSPDMRAKQLQQQQQRYKAYCGK